MIKINQLPPLEVLQSRFKYDPETGIVTYRNSTYGRRSGDRAGRKKSTGYMVVSVDNKSYALHRIIWALHYTELPPLHLQIDHINRDGCDNRISNLRLVTHSGNSRNRGPYTHRKGIRRSRPLSGPLLTPTSNNTSGCPGVYWHIRDKRWVVSVCKKEIGRFKDLDDAIKCRESAVLLHAQ